MSETNGFVLVIIVLSVLSTLVLAGIIVGFLLEQKDKHRQIVVNNSRKIPLIRQLNSSYNFNPLTSSYRIEKECLSKRDYDRLVLSEFLCSLMIEERQFYEELISYAHDNQREHESYRRRFKDILDEETDAERMLYSKWRFFKKVEAEICQGLMQKPVTRPTVTVEKRYCSPQGRKVYRSSRVFNIEEIEKCFFEAKRAQQYRNTSRFERESMSASLRYDVMKRDGFRCVLCGASARDGIKLHVDHILPVSKGGKTELSNLRTLCERCNLGKRAKYDPSGPN